MKGEKITITTTRSFERVIYQEELAALILTQFPKAIRPHLELVFQMDHETGEITTTAKYSEVTATQQDLPFAEEKSPDEPKPKRAYTKRQKPETAVSPAVQKARGGFRQRYISPDKREGGEK
jgi:hypothetical protein